MFHVKHRVITSCFRCRVLLSLRFRIDQIVPNTKQPREVFDEDDLKELSASIKEVGVLQPVVVRSIPATGRSEKLREFLQEKPDARYELIMGERRLRASELAGETHDPGNRS